ncbi:MAG: Na(+)/H(+) antiporter subunit B, partial [Hyphomicrobiales bacterium]|nr:Na(+)/H(+) antiporter subunit B [Hyphomicrobiales bacterium]
MNPSLILRTSAPLLLWVPIFVSLYVLVRGHNDPGGGFIGGLLAAGGILFFAIARGPDAARR